MRSAFDQRLARTLTAFQGSTVDKFIEMRLARERTVRVGRGALASALIVIVAACGGGKDAADPGAADPGAGGSTPTTPTTPTTIVTPTKTEASRFLAQATMGPTEAEIDRLADDDRTRPGSTSSSPSRRRCIASTSTRRRPIRRRRRADQRDQLLRLVVEPGARRRRPAAPARRLRAVRDLRHLVRQRDPAQASRAASRRTTTCWARRPSATSATCSRT